MAISSIHFASGGSGYFSHNSRESETNNVIFNDEENYCSTSKDEAFKMYREELKIRSEAYQERTGQKLQKNATTHISAIFNFNKDTTPEQAHQVGEYLEKLLDTKVIQLAMHRDEGHIIEADSEDIHNGINVDTAIKNYHGHIELMGLDSQGNSIRRKLDKPMLREIQTEVAKILGMERGKFTSYSKEEYQKITNELKPQNEYEDKKAYNKAFSEKAKELGLAKERKAKRLDTYEYKEMAKQRGEAVKELQKELENANAQIQDLKKQNSNLKGSNTKLKKANEALKFDKKELEEQLKKLNNELREKLKENKAVRADFAQLEALNKDLKEDLKNKVLSHEKLIKSFEDLENVLIKKDEEIEELKEKLQLAEKRNKSYFGLNQDLKNEIIALKSQINYLEAQNEVLSSKDIDLKKEDYLSQIVNQYDEKKESSLFKKLQEVDNKLELEAPVKKRSYRER